MADRSLTAAQRDGQACVDCATPGPALHPAGRREEPGTVDGVVHVYDVTRCTRCHLTANALAAVADAAGGGPASARFEAIRMGPGDPYPGLWGIRDHAAGGEWLMVGDEPDRYPLKDLAEQTIRARQYVGGFWQASRG